MNAQRTPDLPLALDLANWLEAVSTGLSANQAAAELRRLHAASERLADQRDELLAALKDFHAWADNQADAQSKGCHSTFDLLMLREQRDIAAEAIAKATGEQA